MARRCPKCGSKMVKDFFTAVVKQKTSDGRYFCEKCGYVGALIWEDGDFRKADLPKSKWLRKRMRY